ncbi:two-component system sensor histidine kinase PrrB [Gordonia jinhuaensis]|uniref:sensor histidine kinase n=1 Tax=Gordonia jinhuaensis TaxID=1517702 RepID=UPI00166D1B7B|nr:HAMP domain-containing sensor histidine kinase [Gordonia jinhuaensis]
MRTPSLRVRVAIATAVGAAIVAGIIAAVAWVVVADDEYQQLDAQVTRLTSVAASVGRARGEQALQAQPDAQGFLATFRRGDEVVLSTSTTVPELPDGLVTENLGGADYRIDTVTRHPAAAAPTRVSIALPLAPTRDRVDARHRQMVIVAALGVIAAATLGWILGGCATRPLRLLAQGIVRGDPSPGLRTGVGGAREGREIAIATTDLLDRLQTEHRRTAQALAAARDFASTSAHELRSPLTAMGTDLDMLRGGYALSDHDRDVLTARLERSHRRVVSTLTALETLARGDLIGPDDLEPVDLVEVIDSSVANAREAFPDVSFDAAHPRQLVVHGFAPGLRLALENLFTNAVRHGHATAVGVRTVIHPDGVVEVVVGDNGSGLPPAERDEVLGRFRRGSTATGPGSGIGLALVAQQARLHGGRVRLADSPGPTGLEVSITIGESARPGGSAH